VCANECAGFDKIVGAVLCPPAALVITRAGTSPAPTIRRCLTFQRKLA
jgi:hypothetical protein